MPRAAIFLAAAVPFVLALASRAAPPAAIWIEAEAPAGENAAAGARWARMESPGYSAGAAVAATCPQAGAEVTAAWPFTCERPGDYEVWARIGWRHWNDHEWRLDDGPWNVSTAVGGNYEFTKVPAPDGSQREASWIAYGKVPLTAGPHTLSVRLRVPEGKERAQQYFDCFCLSPTPFVPAGPFGPVGAVPVCPRAGGPATEAWWPFHPVYPDGESPLLDFAFLNGPVGAHGFVTMKDGDLFFEDGTPVRFWGPNASYWGGQMIYMEKLDADRYADHLAHLGVNIVRIHVLHAINSLIDMTRGDTQHFDPLKLDRLFYVLAALEKRGLYINMDFMYHRTFLEGDGVGPELIRPADAPRGRGEDYNVSWACGAAAFWHPRVIELNLELYRKLLTTVNPHTGRRLIDSPQMAMATVQNEQSAFWGTTNMRRGRTAEILDEIHTAWLKKKYGTQAALRKAWQVEGQASPLAAGEDLDAGRVKVGPLPCPSGGPNRLRALDQKRFLYDLETGFYRRWVDAMRSWGVKCPIITSNWNGAGDTTRLVIQASTVGDIVDRHNYFNRGESMLGAVGKGVPMEGFNQQAGRAFSISEWNHSTDGSFAHESVPAMAVVAAIQGWDALFQFASNGPTFETGLLGLGVTPPHAALYPFASMIWRRGDIATGPVVFERRRDPDWQFGFEQESRVMSTDPAAQTGDQPATMPVPPEVLAIGRVQNAYVDRRTPDLFRADLVERCWNRENGVVTSAAGDVEWRYGEGWVRLDAPRTQGGFGTIGGRRIECRDVAIDTSSTHAAILVSSLDGKPLAEAGRIVVAAVGRAQPNALAAGADAKAPTAPPCLMEPVTGTVSVRTGLPRVRALAVTGHPVADVPAEASDGRIRFKLTGAPQVVYYLVDRP
jgi:hypothetical protein